MRALRRIASRAKPSRARFSPLLVPASWTPGLLFSSGEQGVVFDPSNLPTLSQDDAGATPVTADDQLVGRIADLSGNGNHLTQSTSGSKPKYKTSGGKHWLLPDGLDDWLGSAAFAWGTDKATILTGFNAANGSIHILMQFGNTATETASWDLAQGAVSNGGPRIFRRGTSTSGDRGDGTSQTFPRDVVATFQLDLSGSTHATEVPVVRVNGATPGTLASSGSADAGSGNFGTKSFQLFRRSSATLYSNKPFYGVVAINRLLTDPEIANAEAWLAARAGVTLP